MTSDSVIECRSLAAIDANRAAMHCMASGQCTRENGNKGQSGRKVTSAPQMGAVEFPWAGLEVHAGHSTAYAKILDVFHGKRLRNLKFVLRIFFEHRLGDLSETSCLLVFVQHASNGHLATSFAIRPNSQT
ncbi:unnamed protein product [Durusdinium trenchii]|uniref:Uncharacterized protein n=1 Tax=Durusdinium trenchii TaxID=1381693 RepID=A0ABP0KV56_9DINO